LGVFGITIFFFFFFFFFYSIKNVWEKPVLKINAKGTHRALSHDTRIKDVEMQKYGDMSTQRWNALS
jgi:hypothetical protein